MKKKRKREKFSPGLLLGKVSGQKKEKKGRTVEAKVAVGVVGFLKVRSSLR